MHTEDEANKKWCPHLRTECGTIPCNAYETADGNIGRANFNCCGSECMQWRWLEMPTEMVDSFGSFTKQNRPDLRKGFCGIGGTP